MRLAPLALLAATACATTRAPSSPAAARVRESLTVFRPYNLWELVALSDDIVFADVGPTTEVTHLLEANSDRTRLMVRETWKGNPLEAVEDPQWAGCGHSPRTPKEGTRAVIFSHHHDGQAHLLEVRRPSGPEALTQLRRVVASALALQARGVVRSRAWMNEAMLARATRWDGLIELEMSSGPLRPDEREAFIAAYVASPSVDAALPEAFTLLAPHRTEALDQAFASGFEVAMRGEGHAWFRVGHDIDRLVRARGCRVDDASRYDATSASPQKMVEFVIDGPGVPVANPAGMAAYWERVKRACGLTPKPLTGIGDWNEVRYGKCPE